MFLFDAQTPRILAPNMERLIRWDDDGQKAPSRWRDATMEERLAGIEEIREQYRVMKNEAPYRLERIYSIIDRSTGEVLARGCACGVGPCRAKIHR